MKKEKWMIKFWKDLTKKEFIPIKILFFLIYGGMNTLFPFLSIQARSLGITVDELGIIYSLLPVFGVIAPAVAGMIADKIGNFKVFLSIMVSLSGLASLMFLTIPTGRIIHDLPKDLPLTLSLSRFNASLQINSPLKCVVNNISEVEMNTKECKYICGNYSDQISILNLKEPWCSVTENCDTMNSFTIKFNHSIQNDNYSEKLISFKVSLNHEKDTAEHQLDIHPFHPSAWKDLETREIYNRQNNSYDQEATSECSLQCAVFTNSRKMCNNSQSTEVISPGLTMLAYIGVRLLNSFTLTCSIPLFEGAAIVILKEHNGDFGYQRMFANLGMVVMTPISGVLIDLVSASSGKADFRSAFYMYCCIKFLCAIVIFFMNLEFKKPSNTVLKDVKALLIQPRVSTFLAFTVVSGTCYGFIDTFLFWFLEDMKADKSLMGLAVTAGAVFGIPLLFLSTYIIKRLGHVETLSLSMAIFTIRLLGYSFIQNPWMAMPFEAMEAFTNSLMGVVSVSYSAVLSTPTTVASLQGIYGGTYHGVGRGAGSLIGGFLIKNIGIRITFQILAVASTLASIVYFTVNLFISRRNDKIIKNEVVDIKKSSKENGIKIGECKDP